MMPNFIKLINGDIINIDEILYIHPSKTEECAFLYIKHLYHSSDDISYTNAIVKSKMIKITLQDYDKITQKLGL